MLADRLAAATVVYSIVAVAFLTWALMLAPSSSWQALGAARNALLVTLVAFVFTCGFLEFWIRAASLPTAGGISPGELWLYFGSRWFFLGTGVLVVAAAAIRWPQSS